MTTNPFDDALALRSEVVRFLTTYHFGVEEMLTKVNILRREFTVLHDYNPIEHVGSRVKTPEGILRKAVRKGIPIELDAIREQVLDIAGVRITCSFVSDTYRVRDLLAGQADVSVLEERDYIAHPKPNGYQSLHLLTRVPVFLSDRTEHVPVEVQIRTIAMDFWASLEHKIFYKYDGAVPDGLLAELREAAQVATTLDLRMEALHDQVRALPRDEEADAAREVTADKARTLLEALQRYNTGGGPTFDAGGRDPQGA